MKHALMIILSASIFSGCNNSRNLSHVATEDKNQYYIDVHNLGKGNVTARDVAEAHKKDLATEGKYGVQFINYWVNEASGTVYCLSRAPGKKQIMQTHKEAHGLIPQEIQQVKPGEVTFKTGKSKLFLDIHDLGKGNVTSEAVAEAHMKDLRVEDKYNVKFLNYWVDENDGIVYCLSESDSPDAVIKTHTEAHGLIPNTVMEVLQGE